MLNDNTKVVIPAKKILVADVTHISLVNRGANRVPFRIIKSDDPKESTVFNLDRLFSKNKKGEASNPSPNQMVAIAVATHLALKLEPELQALGFDVTQKTEHKGSTVYKQHDYTDEEVQLVAFSSDLAGLVKTTKGFDSWPETLSFTDNLMVAGFYPSVSMATDALSYTIREAMYESADPTEASATIGKAIDEFKAYLLSVTSSLPVDAFKMEEMAVSLKNETTATLEETQEPESAAVKEPDPVVVSTEVTETTENATIDEPVQKAESDMVVKVLQAMSQLSAKVDGIASQQTELTATVQKTESTLAELQGKVAGTVVKRAESSMLSELAPVVTQKSVDHDVDWDSAFSFPNR